MLGKKGSQWLWLLIFSERTSTFSLESWEIRSSAVFGTRRKAALRGETYAWAPNLRSFDKLREVEVSPYLGFTICLSTLLMFELYEVVRGCLIGSKSWNRSVGFLKPMWTVRDCPRAVWGAMVQICAMNDALMCMRPEMAVKPGFTK